MRMSKLVGRRIKETPRDATSTSHVFLIRGGYIRPVSAGIYTLLPTGKRVINKIEAIIREEMNSIEGQEVLLPVALPAELWEESGRYESTGPELLRFQDRNQKEMLLGMTHEEAVVHAIRGEVNSWKQLPVMLYQIQTKYRDEARPRAGLIRVREFTMKDAYSFHTSQEDLEEYYKRCLKAYERIFTRMGLKNFVSIQSDSGMMGGDIAHEFMAIADCGEDTLFINEDGSYLANREVASIAFEPVSENEKPLEKAHTPEARTIEEVADLLGVKTSQTAKAVFYTDDDDTLVFAVVRGDFEVNETKLANTCKIHKLSRAADEKIKAEGSVPGYASPIGLDPQKVRIVFDPSAVESSNLVVGANEADYHYLNFNFKRDMGESAAKVLIADIKTAREGDKDPVYGKKLHAERGIEVGNIFQLGTKYSSAMDCEFLDSNGKSHPMIMGCYGIGVGRSMAAVLEQSNDKFGPVWPFAIAPFELHICALNKTKEGVGAQSDALYQSLLEAGIDVLYDDRDEKAGSAFNDADLIGVPFRLIVSPKNMQQGKIEFKTRDGSEKEMLDIDKAAAFVTDRIKLARKNARCE